MKMKRKLYNGIKIYYIRYYIRIKNLYVYCLILRSYNTISTVILVVKALKTKIGETSCTSYEREDFTVARFFQCFKLKAYFVDIHQKFLSLLIVYTHTKHTATCF